MQRIYRKWWTSTNNGNNSCTGVRFYRHPLYLSDKFISFSRRKKITVEQNPDVNVWLLFSGWILAKSFVIADRNYRIYAIGELTLMLMGGGSAHLDFDRLYYSEKYLRYPHQTSWLSLYALTELKKNWIDRITVRGWKGFVLKRVLPKIQ